MTDFNNVDYCLVVFVTDWNFSNGGINAFNFDFCLALGDLLKDIPVSLIIVSLNKTETDNSDKAREIGIKVISLGKLAQENFEFSDIKFIATELTNITPTPLFTFIGHDVFTGEFANMMKDAHPNSQSIVFHHMNYEAYYAIKGNTTPSELRSKLTKQSRILKSSDLVIGIGPKLQASAKEKTRRNAGQIIPGLQKIKASVKSNNKLKAITYGRYDAKTDRLKQMLLAVQVYVEWLKQDDSALSSDSVMLVVGISSSEEAETFLTLANKDADRYTNILPLPYTDNRDILFDELSSANVAFMLSIHEGFGLMGLEAIAAEVPLILTINSGLYEFLKNKLKSQSFEDFGIIPVKLKGPIANERVNHEDKITVLNALKKIDSNPALYQNGIKKLKRKLIKQTWAKAAEDFLRVAGLKKPFDKLKSLNAISTDEKLSNNLPTGHSSSLIGRKSYIDDVSNAINRNVNILLLFGPSGVGKSSLAIEIGRKIASQELNIKKEFLKVIWLSASTTIMTYDGILTEQGCSSMEDMLARIAIHLKINEITRKTLNEQEELTIQALKVQKVFLIFDNFEAITDKRILHFLRRLSSVNFVLITAREKISLENSINLRPLDKTDAMILIDREASLRSIQLTEDNKLSIFNLTGGIPLGIQWSIVQVENSSNITTAIKILKDKEHKLMEFCFAEGISRLGKSDGFKLAVALTLFPAGATDSELLHTSGLENESKYENGISVLRKICFIVSFNGRISLLPLTKRFIVKYVQDDSTYFESCKKRHHTTICDFLKPLADKLWTTGINPNEWSSCSENIDETIQLWRHDGRILELCELVINVYPFTLFYGRWHEYIDICMVCLSSNILDRHLRLKLLFRLTSIYEHSGKIKLSDFTMEQIFGLLKSPEELSPEERNLFNFITTVRSINRGYPETDSLIEHSIAFEKTRNMDWTLIGFMGWKGTHLCNTNRFEEGKKTLEDAIKLSTNYKQFRSLTFLFPVYLKIINALNSRPFQLGYNFSDMINLANEYAEIHNKAHLLKEIGLYEKAYNNLSSGEAYLSQAKVIYDTLGMTENAQDLQTYLTK